MAYTNVTLPEKYPSEHEPRKVIAKLEFELKYQKEENQRLLYILHSIPAAIEKWGYVNIDTPGKDVITLIRQP